MGIAFGTYTPVLPEAKPLVEHGDALITVTSRVSGHHVTIRIRCYDTGPTVVAWAKAERVVFTDFDGETIASYRPSTGAMSIVSSAPGRDVWTVGAVLRYLAGEFPLLAAKANVDVADANGRSIVAA
jgi:hypothetical protein